MVVDIFIGGVFGIKLKKRMVIEENLLVVVDKIWVRRGWFISSYGKGVIKIIMLMFEIIGEGKSFLL